jgi:site-specific DNA recombinase
MIRAALYARYSSDKQDCRSIDDQLALGRKHCEREGWAVVGIYADREISGASTLRRDHYNRMVADARAGKFDVIWAEDIDRLARNQIDTLQLRGRMEFIGVQIHTSADGRVTKLNAGFKGLMSEMFLDNLALHVRRGQAGRVSEGRAGGGLTYGYDVLPPELVAGGRKPRRGARAINEREAEIVRRIFADYVAGARPRTIVLSLNRDRIPPPRGSEWRPSTLIGNVQRGSGILNNELYCGRLVWNKVRMIKDPDTGRRVSRPNPKSEWQIVDVPDLRIVDPQTYAAAQALKTYRAKMQPQHRRAPKRLLSGLLRCGCCGAGMAIKDARDSKYRRVQCSRMKEAGTCDNRRAYAVEPIERRVIEHLRTHLRDPRAIERFLTTYRAERKRLAIAEGSRRGAMERRLGEVKRELNRTISSLIKGLVPAEAIGPHITQLNAERKALEASLEAAVADKIVALHPAAIARYLAAVDDLAADLSVRAIDTTQESPKALRELIDSVLIHSRDGEPGVEIKGRLAALTQAEMFPQTKAVGLSMVAEVRYRQSPQSLFSLWAA